ncbi:MAG: putative transport system ATP-binding protein, partial [Frankiales bacterium]|nr:putative transport system ATP-binding protein [Frankiales bacterium]
PDLLDQLGLAAVAGSHPRTLSGGETARAGLAVALATRPVVLLADEPTAEISRAEEADLLGALRELCPPDGAVVLVTHSERVAAWADRVVHLVDGRLA